MLKRPYYSSLLFHQALTRQKRLPKWINKENKGWPQANRLDVKETRYSLKGMKIRTYQVITSNDITT